MPPLHAGIALDAQHQGEHATTHNQAGAAIADKRQGQAFGRQQAGAHAHIHKGWPEDQRDAVADVGAKRIGRRQSAATDRECARSGRYTGNNGQCADKSGLLGPDGKHKIGVRFGQVEQFLHAVAQANAQPFPATESDQRLGELETGIEGSAQGSV